MLPAHSTSYFGSVGRDGFAQAMRDAASKDGVRVLYQVDEQAPTGTCAVLVNGDGHGHHHRSLVANLSAANNFRPAHLEKSENWAVVEAARFFYVSGFFLTVSLDSILKIAQHAADTNKVRFRHAACLLTISLSLSLSPGLSLSCSLS